MANLYYLLAHVLTQVSRVFKFFADEFRFQGNALTIRRQARRIR